MTRAGFPPTSVLGGTSLVTTEPAATTEFSPTVTPPMMVAPAAIHTFFSITIGFPIVAARRCEGSRGWPVLTYLTSIVDAHFAIDLHPKSNYTDSFRTRFINLRTYCSMLFSYSMLVATSLLSSVPCTRFFQY
jgi:hypothetical protein